MPTDATHGSGPPSPRLATSTSASWTIAMSTAATTESPVIVTAYTRPRWRRPGVQVYARRITAPWVVSKALIPAANRMGRVSAAHQGTAASVGGTREREQPDLGGGVEAEAEQQTDDVHPRRAIHRFLEGPEHSKHRSARVPVMVSKGRDVDRGDDEQEDAGDGRADDPCPGAEGRGVIRE